MKVKNLGLLLILLLLSMSARGQKVPEEYRSPFRYVIVAGVSATDKYANEQLPLNMIVLMDDKAFNEGNLRTLFTLIAKRYPEAPQLSVDVYTTLDAIMTPEESDHADLWGAVAGYQRFKYAFLSKNGHGEYFSYGIPGKLKETKVWIKRTVTKN